MTIEAATAPAILFVGCGRMGSALASRWVCHHPVLVFHPKAPPPLNVRIISSLDDDLPDELIIVLAVKPQVYPDLLPSLKKLFSHGPRLLLSVMAGLSLGRLQEDLGLRRIARAMPNLPAAIGAGVTALVASPGLDDQDRRALTALFMLAGTATWLDDEAALDAVTAVSGSGPAYFYRITEALAQAGEWAGLSAGVAMQFARQTFVGTGALAATDVRTLADMREDVTSPGGTTLAALTAIEGEIDELIKRAVAAAMDRARLLSNVSQ